MNGISVPFVEKDCTIEHQGRKFTSGGAVVTKDFIVGYPAKDGIITDWHGNKIGTWRETSRWRVNSHMGSHMLQIEAKVNGITYTGRGFGEGMIYNGKAKKSR